MQNGGRFNTALWFSGILTTLPLCLNHVSKSKHELQTAQNKAVRFILKLDPRSHTGQHELTILGLLYTSDKV